MNIGYARVSTGLQNLDLQKDSLKKYNCEKIFTDHMSGSKRERPGLKSAIEFSRPGDTIVVWRLDRLGRNIEDLINIVNSLNNKAVSFHSLQENITMDKSSSTGQLMFHLFAAFGDGDNDIELLRMASHSYAMENASPALLQVADQVEPHHKDQGVLTILEDYLGLY
ncbi:HAD hydrolase family protein [Streptococcus thermophilus]|nr:HAD hydrolase family protein [Streptococcus thermophilus]MCE2216483.1 HAD hydrolase family protein [Streptococcus thermophilus]MCE2219737.1 HAD hydrolase family protein [Streptococcus thermophilus]MCE2261953.1 HAD hydrolase family protein [Streptococcus thermophilus]